MLIPVVQSDVEDKLEDVDDLELRVHDQSVLLFHRYRQRLASLAVGGCSTATATTDHGKLIQMQYRFYIDLFIFKRLHNKGGPMYLGRNGCR